MKNNFFGSLVGFVTITSVVIGIALLWALAMVLLFGMIASIIFLQAMIGGTFLYFFYPFLHTTLLPTVGVESLTWLNSVYIIMAFNLIRTKVSFGKNEQLVNGAKKFVNGMNDITKGKDPTKKKNPKEVYGSKR